MQGGRWPAETNPLQELLEFRNAQTSIVYDSSHRVSVDGVCPRYCDDPLPVGHYDVFALPRDPETVPFKSFHSPLMIYPGETRH